MYQYVIALFLYLQIVQGTFVVSWGSNSFGQLGTGSTDDTSIPIAIPEYAVNGRTVANIRTGLSTHFAMMTDGSVYCSGNNIFGQLGINSNLNQYSPVKNPLALGFDVYPLGPQTIAFNASTKDVFGWGNDAGYMLGGSFTGNQLTPAQSTNPDFAGIALGVSTAWSASFVILNGGAFVAGRVLTYNSFTTPDTPSKLGTGATADQPNFVRMSFWNNNPLKRLFPTTSSHACGLSKSYSLYCWGKNNAGQLGVGHTLDMNVPQLVSFFDTEDLYVAQLKTGDSHTIALTCGGKVYSWGNNARGNLGLGTRDTSPHPNPTLIGSLSTLRIIEIDSAANSVFARNKSNFWYVWGAATNNITLVATTDDVLLPYANPYFSQRNLTRIAVSSKSNFAFAWNDANPLMTPAADCPALSNECELGVDNCALNTQCVDTERAYKCICGAGFTGNGIDPSAGGTGCEDVDECVLNVCVQAATCDNELGSYWCTCPDGYRGDGRINGTGCVDIDECAVGGWCPPNSNCANTIGAYTCSCKAGFRNIGSTPCGVICTDIDECNVPANACASNMICVNRFGNYSCQCAPGYAGTSCADVNECTSGKHNCASAAYCVNQAGAFTCECPAGFEGDALSPAQGGSGCRDINECALSQDTCSPYATCVNTAGSYACVCMEGYAGNGFVCSDIDECLTNTQTCVNSAVCTNTVGGYACACQSGFTGNGVLPSSGGTGCTDIDECATGGACSSLATCQNTPGSFSCSSCPQAYQGDGKSCYTVTCPIGSYANSTTTCDKCPAGTYNNRTGVGRCAACPAGTFSTAIGKTTINTCQSCPKNKFSPAGSASCATCAAGSVATSTGSAACQLCPAGQYGFQGVCQNCGVGFFSTTAGSTECQPCPPGSYANSSTATSCAACPAGSVSKGRAATCDLCPEGKYAPVSGHYACTSCAPGTATQGSKGATQCTPCSAGSFAQYAGSSSCSICSAGTYSSKSGSDSCQDCTPGTYQNSTGRTSCTKCSNWMYQDESAQLQCKDCYQGFQAEFEYGSTTCLSCPAGTFRTFGAVAVCTPCYTGSASALAGQAHCAYCMGGYAARKCGQATCDACAPGSYSSFLATGRDRCPYCPYGQASFGTAYFCYY